MSAHSEARPTFEVDKEGLRKLLADRSPAFAVFELVQNAWDEEVTKVEVRLEPLDPKTFGHPTYDDRYLLTVTDDNPEGFKDLTHAYTLFAESEKKDQADKRGRFNLGEKLVIAVCERAWVRTTTGTIEFNEAGRFESKPERKRGSEFSGVLVLTADEYEEVVADVSRLIVPDDIETTFNGEVLGGRTPVRTFEATLATVLDTEGDGNMRRTYRKTTVRLFEPTEDEIPYLYEMGIPVVELEGDRWHVDVGQKVELNMNRDNVPPAYRRALRARVLEGAGDLLTEEDGDAVWLTEALTDRKLTEQGANLALTVKFGENRVQYDPSDVEANGIAVTEGYRVVHSREIPRDARAVIRNFPTLLLPAGQVTPSPRPYNPGEENTRATLPVEKWTDGMRLHVAFVRALGKRILDADVTVEIVNDPTCMNFSATYGRSPNGQAGRFEFNMRTLGRKWFEKDPTSPECLSLTIHEFGHHRESNHLSREYYRALTDIGAEVTALALSEPDFFEPAGYVMALEENKVTA